MELWKEKLIESISLYKKQYGEEQTIKKYEMFILGLNDPVLSVQFINMLPHSDIKIHKQIVLNSNNPEMCFELLKLDPSTNIEQVRKTIIDSGNKTLIHQFATLVNQKIGSCIDDLTGEITDINQYNLLVESSVNLLANGQISSINDMYTFSPYSVEELIQEQDDEINTYNNLVSLNNNLNSTSISLKPLTPSKEEALKDISDIINYENLYGDNSDYKSL